MPLKESLAMEKFARTACETISPPELGRWLKKDAGENGTYRGTMSDQEWNDLSLRGIFLRSAI
jgi:hypothetical protein